MEAQIKNQGGKEPVQRVRRQLSCPVWRQLSCPVDRYVGQR
jgi:hypothetical protein